MTLRKILEKAEDNRIQEECLLDLAKEFEIYDLNTWSSKRVTSCYLKVRYDTDAFVGIKAYFLDNDFICISKQINRKSDTKFDWISKKAYFKTFKFIKSISDSDLSSIDIISKEDLLNDWGNYYHVQYASELIFSCQKYFFEGDPVSFDSYVEIPPGLNEFCKFINNYSYAEVAKFKIKDNIEKIIPVKDIDIEWINTGKI